MTFVSSRILAFWGCASSPTVENPCADFTDRSHKSDGGIVINGGEEPFWVISSDFHIHDRVRFRLPAGHSSKGDFCVSDIDAIPFESGILVWVDGQYQSQLSQTGPGVFRLRDGYTVTAIYRGGILSVSYESHSFQEFFGYSPEILQPGEAERGDLQLHPDQALPIYVPRPS